MTRAADTSLVRAALEAAPVGLLLVDADGTIVAVNATASRLFAWDRDELVGAKIESLVPSRFHGAHQRQRDAYLAAPAARAMGVGSELFARRRDGTEFPVEIGLTPIGTSDGSQVLASVIDISARVRVMDQLRLAIEASPAGMVMVDERGRIVLVNAQVEALFGHPRGALVGRSLELLVPARFRARHPSLRDAFLAAPKARPMGAGRDLFGLRADGTEIPIEIGISPIHTADGWLVLASVVDISERKRGEEERERLVAELRAANGALEDRGSVLKAAVRERETMLQEIHHRVKNNLQVISSLINLQTRQLSSESARPALEDVQRRIAAMALIHEQLYEANDYAQIPFDRYAASLAHGIASSHERTPGRVRLVLDLSPVRLPVDRAIPCGLLLNELVTNALKHAFPDERRGALTVTLHDVGPRRMELVVADDGVGIPAGTDLRRHGSVGSQIVFALAEQLGAELEVQSGAGGTTFRVSMTTEERDG